MEPPNWWFVRCFFPFPRRHFQVPVVSFREGNCLQPCYKTSVKMHPAIRRSSCLASAIQGGSQTGRCQRVWGTRAMSEKLVSKSFLTEKHQNSRFKRNEKISQLTKKSCVFFEKDWHSPCFSLSFVDLLFSRQRILSSRTCAERPRAAARRRGQVGGLRDATKTRWVDAPALGTHSLNFRGYNHYNLAHIFI